MGRKPCCEKVGLKKGPWTAEEDKKLVDFILNNGHCCWRAVPKLAGLLRCGKSCRLRWTNYLRPDLKRGELSDMEEQLIMELHSKLGNRWAKIAGYLPGRTDNEIKNHWNTHIKKKLRRMGIDPVTHQPIAAESSSSAQLNKLPAENSEGKGIVEPERVAEAVQSFEPGQICSKEVLLASTNQAEPDEKIIDSSNQQILSGFGVHGVSMFVEDVSGSNPGSSSDGREKTFSEYLRPEIGAQNTPLFHPQGVTSVLQADDNLMWELGDFVGCFAKTNTSCLEALESCNAALSNMDLMSTGSILAPAEMNGHPWEHCMDPFLGWEGDRCSL